MMIRINWNGQIACSGRVCANDDDTQNRYRFTPCICTRGNYGKVSLPLSPSRQTENFNPYFNPCLPPPPLLPSSPPPLPPPPPLPAQCRCMFNPHQVINTEGSVRDIHDQVINGGIKTIKPPRLNVWAVEVNTLLLEHEVGLRGRRSP